MSEGWQTLSLADAGVTLLDCDHKTPEAVDSGWPYVGIPQMTTGRVDFSTARRITHADFLAWTRKTKYQKDDVILSRRTNPGVTAIDDTGTEFALGQNLVLLRADGTKVYPPFLRWLVRGPEWWVQIEKFINVGAVFSSLRCRDVPNFELTIPPLPDQRAIAATLGALDDKIELNRKMNATLEAMARALFRDWFVDFGPTRAKMEGRPPYLSPDLWSLFPDRLDNEGKPEGWEEKPLTEFFAIIGGGTPKTSNADFWDGPIPWFSVTDTPPNGSVFVTDTEKTITEAGLNGSSARLVPKGTTIISARGTVGNLAVAGRDMTFNQSCYALRGAGPVGDYATFLIAQNMVSQLQAMAHGSVFSTITRQTFESLSLPMPTERVLQAFEDAVSPLFDKILANVQESRTLAHTRDLLLPRLMSGELRVAESERLVGEVA